jgi:hypothetical protein
MVIKFVCTNLTQCFGSHHLDEKNLTALPIQLAPEDLVGVCHGAETRQQVADSERLVQIENWRLPVYLIE